MTTNPATSPGGEEKNPPGCIIAVLIVLAAAVGGLIYLGIYEYNFYAEWEQTGSSQKVSGKFYFLYQIGGKGFLRAVIWGMAVLVLAIGIALLMNGGEKKPRK